MACRGWNSSDVTSCIAAFDTPGAVPSIPVHRLLRDSSMSLASGIQDGARASGFDDALLDLPHALRAMLRDGVPGADALTDSWLAGKMLPVVMKAQPAPDRVQGSDGLWRPVA